MAGSNHQPKGVRYGGRAKGTPNKATVERALEAERALQKARANARPLAKEVLDNIMGICMNMAKRYASEPDEKPNPEKLNEFERWLKNALDAARWLAPFQSPTIKAILLPDQHLGLVMELKSSDLMKTIEERGLPASVFGRDLPILEMMAEEVGNGKDAENGSVAGPEGKGLGGNGRDETETD